MCRLDTVISGWGRATILGMNEDGEQKSILNAALTVVKQQAFGMNRAIDADNITPDPVNLKTALDFATEMLRELRSNTLTPKNYYELYMAILDHLNTLQDYFSSLKMPVVKLYEQVQSCGNVVPRLYLLCCAGTVYIESKEAPAKDILKDLVEMAKGVQHPIRGLFLRNYLTQISKNKLPDVGSPYEGEGGTVQDAYEFILQNFAETNRLWVRLQTQGAGNKNKKKRESERQDLRILVGLNLVRLSQLEGLDVDTYKAQVLPKILEEVVDCKDKMAQTYLMDCLIQVFPDDFHFATLNEFLTACVGLKEKVNVRAILEALMDRLSSHVAEGGEMPQDVNMFKLFNDCVTSLIEERSNMSLSESLLLQASLVNFALKCYPSRIDYVQHCLESSSKIVESSEIVDVNKATIEAADDRLTDDVTVQIENLLFAPLEKLALRVLEIGAFGRLMACLPWGNKKAVSVSLVSSVIKSGTILSEVEQLEQLLGMITPLLRDREGATPVLDEDGQEKPPSDEFVSEQQLIAKLVHRIDNDDTDVLIKLYVAASKYFQDGGVHRIKHNMPPLVFASLRLARKVRDREAAATAEGSDGDIAVEAPQYSTRKVFHFILQITRAISAAKEFDMALRLFLMAANAADECCFPQIAYELFKDAPILFETEVETEKSKVRALVSMIGTLLNCNNFTADDYDIVTRKLCQYSGKRLKTIDRCRMITLSSHLFWPPPDADGKNRFADDEETNQKSVECMKKAISIVRDEFNAGLFIEILNRYIYHFEQKNPAFEVKFLSGLIALINNQLQAGSVGQPPEDQVEVFYLNTLKYLQAKQADPQDKERFGDIVL